MAEKVLELTHDTVIYKSLGIKAYYDIMVDGAVSIRKLISRPDGRPDTFEEIVLPKEIFEKMVAFYAENK